MLLIDEVWLLIKLWLGQGRLEIAVPRVFKKNQFVLHKVEIIANASFQGYPSNSKMMEQLQK